MVGKDWLDNEAISRHFSELTLLDIEFIVREYGATHLLTEGRLPNASSVYESGTYRVFDLHLKEKGMTPAVETEAHNPRDPSGH